MSLSELYTYLAGTPGAHAGLLPPNTPVDVMVSAIKVQLYQITALADRLATNNTFEAKEDAEPGQPVVVPIPLTPSQLQTLADLESHIQGVMDGKTLESCWYANLPVVIKPYYRPALIDAREYEDDPRAGWHTIKVPGYEVIPLSQHHLLTLKNMLYQSYVANILTSTFIYPSVYARLLLNLQPFYIRANNVYKTKGLSIDDVIYLRSLV